MEDETLQFLLSSASRFLGLEGTGIILTTSGKRAGKESFYIEVDTSFARRRNSERSSGRKGREKREKEEKTRGLYRELQIIRASSELRRRMAEERANFSWRFPTCTQPFNLTSPCRKRRGDRGKESKRETCDFFRGFFNSGKDESSLCGKCGEENDSKVKTEESPVIVDSQARYPEISESSSWDIRKDSQRRISGNER
uniref:Uncharacterized protein n=1 Tax=Vespula pensylvanica TaxID=30213 RepID=A0A834PA67_VESPE|nr:hypothetical protein H0235_002469 [Vespula pensylvanica]